MNSYIFAILIGGGLLLIIASRKTKRNRIKRQYEILRNSALETTAEKMGAKNSGDRSIIYGICLDFWIAGEIATLVVFWSGDLSVYYGTGPFIDGDQRNQNLLGLATRLIEKSYSYLDKASLTEMYPIPDKNHINFYFLTTQGKYKATESMEKILSKESPWLDLFNEGKNVYLASWK